MLHAILAPKPAWRRLQTQRINGPAHLCPRWHPQPHASHLLRTPPHVLCAHQEAAYLRGLPAGCCHSYGPRREAWRMRGQGPWDPGAPQPPEGGFCGCPWGRWCIRTQGCLLSESQGTGSQSRQAGGRGHTPLVAVYRHPPSRWVLLPSRIARVLRGRNRARGAQTEEAAPCRW